MEAANEMTDGMKVQFCSEPIFGDKPSKPLFHDFNAIPSNRDMAHPVVAESKLVMEVDFFDRDAFEKMMGKETSTYTVEDDHWRWINVPVHVEGTKVVFDLEADGVVRMPK